MHTDKKNQIKLASETARCQQIVRRSALTGKQKVILRKNFDHQQYLQKNNIKFELCP